MLQTKSKEVKHQCIIVVLWCLNSLALSVRLLTVEWKWMMKCLREGKYDKRYRKRKEEWLRDGLGEREEIDRNKHRESEIEGKRGVDKECGNERTRGVDEERKWKREREGVRERKRGSEREKDISRDREMKR